MEFIQVCIWCLIRHHPSTPTHEMGCGIWEGVVVAVVVDYLLEELLSVFLITLVNYSYFYSYAITI